MPAKRRFIPGEEWIYLKIYGGPKLLERILVQELFHLLMELFHDQVIDSYFFIRYSDPDYHVRLRMHTLKQKDVISVIKSLGAILSTKVQDRSLIRISCETYNREIERYGEFSITLAENLFFLDSSAVLRFLALSDRSDDLRWLFSMYWIDQLLNLFRYEADRKSHFLNTGYQNYAQEFGIHKPARVVMDKKYRKLTNKMEVLFYSDDMSKIKGHIRPVIDTWRKNANPIVAQILDLDSTGRLQVGLDPLISSLVHMHINRMFRSRPRKYELLIYHFLNKFHTSRKVREFLG